MTAALHLLVTLAICTAAVGPLARARWVWRAPGTGIALWQMLALTWVLSAIGVLLGFGLRRHDEPIPFALAAWRAGESPLDVLVVAGLVLTLGLLGAVTWSWISVARLRRRHRDVLALVARKDSAAPGALVVDHPTVVAYCVSSEVVVSSGALRTLSRAEVLAVLAHERSHARERHDLVLLPFTALRRWCPRAADAVALLVEMRADERACREHGPHELAAALRRFTTSVPAGALGMAGGAVAARLERIASPRTLPAWVRWSVLVSGVVLVSTPLSFLVF